MALLDYVQRLRKELDALPDKQVQRGSRIRDDRDIDRLVRIVDERLAEAVRREGDF
jgi:hypothetical protein